jgi:hypothetical protein
MKKEIVTGLISVAGLAVLPNLAFSFGVRKQMIIRDNAECVECGKRFNDGWLLDCAHNDHDHSNPDYDNPNNGRVLCLDDHLKHHIKIGDKNGAYLIRKRIEETHGGRTRKWIAENIDNH